MNTLSKTDQDAGEPSNGTRIKQAEARTNLANSRTNEANTRTQQAENREHAMRASELSYRRLFEAARDGILILDADTGRITDVNPFLVELLGFSTGEMIGKTVGELSPRKDMVSNQAIFTRLQKDGHLHYEDLPLETKDGHHIAVEFVANVYQAGVMKVIQCNIRDITKRKQIEERLKIASTELGDLKAALDEHALVAITDPQGRITYVNDKFCAISKYAREELLGQDHRITSSGFHSKEFIRDLWTTIASGKVWKGEIKNKAKDGSFYWEDTTIVPFLSTDGNPYQYVAICVDITRHKQTEDTFARLSASAFARLAAIVEFSDDAIVGKDLTGVVTSWNAGAETLFGFSAREIIGQPITRIVPSGRQQEEIEIMTRIGRGESVKHFETERIRKDGSLVCISVTISPIKDLTGKIVGASKVARDNTERKQMEEQLRTDVTDRMLVNQALQAANKELAFQVEEKCKRADELAAIVEERTVAKVELAFQVEEKSKRADELAVINVELTRSKDALERSNVELGQFAYVASHDLQTPLRNINGFVQLLKANYAGRLDEKADGWINRIAESSRQMHTLIEDVLTYSRVDSRERPFELVSFEDVFNDSVVLIETSIHDSGGEVTHDELPSVMGDRSQLVQLTQNLIGNGLKYHGEKPPHIHVSARHDGSSWLLSVHDNGIGIAPKHHERIFEIFKRLHNQQEYPGTGIGLAVCRRVINRHGGKIWVESEGDGHGSTFNFTIPEAETERL